MCAGPDTGGTSERLLLGTFPIAAPLIGTLPTATTSATPSSTFRSWTPHRPPAASPSHLQLPGRCGTELWIREMFSPRNGQRDRTSREQRRARHPALDPSSKRIPGIRRLARPPAIPSLSQKRRAEARPFRHVIASCESASCPLTSALASRRSRRLLPCQTPPRPRMPPRKRPRWRRTP